MIKDVILVVDTKTLEWLKGKSRDEMIGFALNSCEVIADDVWIKIKSWMQTSGAVPSIFNMPGTWDPSKCAEVILQAKKEYKDLEIAVRTGTTGFGGKIAVALCMDDSSQNMQDSSLQSKSGCFTSVAAFIILTGIGVGFMLL
jgi:hypothetical protein